jgi:hypothetical protein
MLLNIVLLYCFFLLYILQGVREVMYIDDALWVGEEGSEASDAALAQHSRNTVQFNKLSYYIYIFIILEQISVAVNKFIKMHNHILQS